MTRLPSGIYKITNLTNGKIYVGQSQNVFLRRAQHFTALKNNSHENSQMQQDWNKDSRGFRFDVIEFCPLKDLNAREKYWIEKLNTIECGYNQGWVPYKRKAQKKPSYKKHRYHKTS